MNDELRDAIGKALYEASVDFSDARTPLWDSILNKEEWMLKAQKVVAVYKAWLVEHAPPMMRREQDKRSR